MRNLVKAPKPEDVELEVSPYLQPGGHGCDGVRWRESGVALQFIAPLDRD